MPTGYRDEDEVLAELQASVDQAGPAGELTVIGSSVQGRPIHSLTVGRQLDPGGGRDTARPLVGVIASMHGNEVIASEMALAIARALVASPEGGARTLLDVADVVVVPSVNPDGRARALASLGRRRPFVSAPRRNANGVDLNRNWPWSPGAVAHWLPVAGTDRPWLPWYRGPSPGSEPEVQALISLFERRPPAALVNLHSVGEIITHPWSWQPAPPPDAEAFAAMSAAFNEIWTGEAFRSKQSNAWYPIVGSANDFLYEQHRTLAVTIELSRIGVAVRRCPQRAPWLFWWANPDDPQSYVSSLVEPCLASLVAAVEARS